MAWLVGQVVFCVVIFTHPDGSLLGAAVCAVEDQLLPQHLLI